MSALLRSAGAAVVRGGHADGTLLVTGLAVRAVGDLAAEHGIALHELAERRASLEDAFVELTGDCLDYQGRSPS